MSSHSACSQNSDDRHIIERVIDKSSTSIVYLMLT
jgi:hypothetical protein